MSNGAQPHGPGKTSELKAAILGVAQKINGKGFVEKKNNKYRGGGSILVVRTGDMPDTAARLVGVQNDVMAWKASSVMDWKLRFVIAYERNDHEFLFGGSAGQQATGCAHGARVCFYFAGDEGNCLQSQVVMGVMVLDSWA